MTRSICSFPDCGRIVHSGGLCKSHDQQKRRGGPVVALRPAGGSIPRDEAFWSYVDKSGDCWEWTAYRAADGYGRFGSGGKFGPKILTHRFSWELCRGPIPDGMFLDHICHNRGCVNPDHLRLATPKQNAENLRGASRDSRTGVRGVTWDRKNKKYRVLVGHNRRTIHGGRYADLEEAAEAARQLRLSLFTHSDLDRKSA
jgi:hypothetical protein